MEKKFPQGQDLLETVEYSCTLYRPLFYFPFSNAFEVRTPTSPNTVFSIPVWWSSSLIQNISRKPGSCWRTFHATRRRMDCVLFGRLGSRIPAVLIEILWNCQSELFSAGWVAAVTGVGGWWGLKQQRCFTLQYSDDTSDIFIDSNKGQTTKAESKIEENTSRNSRSCPPRLECVSLTTWS